MVSSCSPVTGLVTMLTPSQDTDVPTSIKDATTVIAHDLPPRPSTPQLHQAASYHHSDSPRASTSSAPASPSAPSTSKRAQDRRIDRTALSLILLFNGPSGPSIHNTEDQAPPAFFPLQRISFSPRLRISNKSGLAIAGPPSDEVEHDREQVTSMLLGVTGVIETLSNGRVKARRVIADYVTDLTSGVNIWRRDAEAVVAKKRRAKGLTPLEPEADGSAVLPPGTYVLPLSMRIPTSDKLCVPTLH